mmetsp:Transcript_56507/g.165913  ORF Transcript_56507/g.165913 Transcript_56507/m.165913 type:complete len:219 (-) Transcript_56507:191-847(-)
MVAVRHGGGEAANHGLRRRRTEDQRRVPHGLDLRVPRLHGEQRLAEHSGHGLVVDDLAELRGELLFHQAVHEGEGGELHVAAHEADGLVRGAQLPGILVEILEDLQETLRRLLQLVDGRPDLLHHFLALALDVLGLLLDAHVLHVRRDRFRGARVSQVVHWIELVQLLLAISHVHGIGEEEASMTLWSRLAVRDKLVRLAKLRLVRAQRMHRREEWDT